MRVYPRERGGTYFDNPNADQEEGLSPRTRGNLGVTVHRNQKTGSIPANAGEPLTRHQGPTLVQVYPRERGGTIGAFFQGLLAQGLSPRTRGNHHPQPGHSARGGSIPANAGEPLEKVLLYLTLRVYPRERGGTKAASALPSVISGLSPRTRGNRVQRE